MKLILAVSLLACVGVYGDIGLQLRNLQVPHSVYGIQPEEPYIHHHHHHHEPIRSYIVPPAAPAIVPIDVSQYVIRPQRPVEVLYPYKQPLIHQLENTYLPAAPEFNVYGLPETVIPELKTEYQQPPPPPTVEHINIEDYHIRPIIQEQKPYPAAEPLRVVHELPEDYPYPNPIPVMPHTVYGNPETLIQNSFADHYNLIHQQADDIVYHIPHQDIEGRFDLSILKDDEHFPFGDSSLLSHDTLKDVSRKLVPREGSYSFVDTAGIPVSIKNV